MSAPTPAIVASREAETSPEEWDARVELAACYRIFEMLGWTEMIFNHITLRLPGPQRHFLINPYGLWYGEVTASNLVKIDLDGNLIGPSEWPINRAGFVIHSAIHAARDDAHCIMHTHTTAGMAIACQRDGLAPDNFYSALMHGHVAYHAFEGVTVRDDEKARLVRSRRQELPYSAQPRPARLRPHGAGGILANVDYRTRLSDSARCPGDGPTTD